MNNFSSLLKQHNLHELDSSPPPPSEDFLDQILSSVPNSTTSSSFPWSADDPGFFNHKPSMLHHQHQMFLRNRPLQSNDHNDQLLDASPFQSHNHLQENDASLKSQLFNGFNDGQNSEHFHHNQGGAMQSQNLGAAVSGSSGGGGAAPRQRVRAKRGQATDPHSIAERLRRERIAERMKNLQELVPNGNKTDKASMLDEIIDYVKFLQLQVKVLSVSRLGGASAVAPLMADMASASEGRGSMANISNGTTSMENDVAKLLEEDMGSAMQYLQGKGLCLMPISLASAISTVTRNPNNINTTANNQGPTSPSMSALTVQSATVGGCGSGEPASRKDGNSVSKP